jgi:hypothetical protein
MVGIDGWDREQLASSTGIIDRKIGWKIDDRRNAGAEMEKGIKTAVEGNRPDQFCVAERQCESDLSFGDKRAR